MKKVIVTVCWGNMFRSVLLKLRLDQELARRGMTGEYEVLSRGIMGSCGVKAPKHKNVTGYPVWQHCRPRFEALGIQLPSEQTSTPITRSAVETATIILAADRKVLRDDLASLSRRFPSFTKKMFLFTVLIGGNHDVDDIKEDDTEENVERGVRAVDDIASRGFDRLIALISSSNCQL